MGSGSDGGYLGGDALAFLSSLLSGAAGAYRLIVHDDAEVHTDIIVQPGMDVHMVGSVALTTDPPAWGTGSFTVREHAKLSIDNLLLDLAATITVIAGGDLSLANLELHSDQLEWTETVGSTLSLSSVDFTGPSLIVGDPCDGFDGATITPLGVGGSDGEIVFQPEGGTPNNPLVPSGHTGRDFGALCSWTLSCTGATVEFIEFETEGTWDGVKIGVGANLANNMGHDPDYVIGGPSDDHARVGWITGALHDDGSAIGRRQADPNYDLDFGMSPSVYTARPDENTTIGFFADGSGRAKGFRALYSCPGTTEITQSYTVAEDGHSLTDSTPGAKAWQCFEEYTPFRTEAWRLTTHVNPGDPEYDGDVETDELPWSEGKYYCDSDSDDPAVTGMWSPGTPREQIVLTSPRIDGETWFRLAGEGGDALATLNGVWEQHGLAARCGGRDVNLWLTELGPSGNGLLPDYSFPVADGLQLEMQDGVKPMMMCGSKISRGWHEHSEEYQGPPQHMCMHSWTIHAVHCGDFLLWKLQPVHLCTLTYCTAPSGLPNANAVMAIGTDCQGHYTECTRACETGEDRSWIEYAAQSGYGKACPPPSSCRPGYGACRGH